MALPAQWHSKLDGSADAQTAASIAADLACPLPIVQILVSRGIINLSTAQAFLNPTLAGFLADPANHPTQLLGMASAVTRILQAVHKQEPILIYGDYDVDGTTATVLLKTTIERIGLALEPKKPQQVSYHVPHRIREGYGMQTSVLAQAAASGIRLVISVDTGIRAIAEAREARALALDLIVTDHHLPESAPGDDEASLIPDALAVINPNQPACPYPNKNLCGAAVAFKLAHALLLAAAPLTPDPTAFLTRTERILLPSFLKLVAIATIADSVPLTGENRAIAALGLAALANPVQPGLRALMELAKLPLDRAPTASEVGFRLAPRINAAGRMDIASDVVELFLTRDPTRALQLATKLDALNQARRDSEARALHAIDEELCALLIRTAPAQGAESQADAYPADVIVLDHPDWHRGVLGILASRVVDRTGRPALVLTHADGDAHGSGRSIPGFHLLDAITAANLADSLTETAGNSFSPLEPAAGAGAPPLDSEMWDGSPENSTRACPLFHRFGGHAHAVGFSLPSGSLPLLRARLSTYAAGRLTAGLLTPETRYDAELSLAEITPELHRWIARLAPFGIGNREPVFLTRSLELAAPVRVIKDRHICLQLTQAGAADATEARTISALGWSRGGSDRSNSPEPSNSSAIPGIPQTPDPAAWTTRCMRLGLAPGSIVDILYRLRQNSGAYANPAFGGLELELCDLRLTHA
jgi:single-stranded-DNA-specific exonuclease